MTAKTTAYARRRARQAAQGHLPDPLAGLRRIDYSRPYSNDPDGGASATITPMLRVRQAFEALRMGTVTPDNTEPFDLLAHALGVATLRAQQISELLLPPLQRASLGLQRTQQRYHTHHVWGFDGPALQDIPQGIDIYEQILTLSSPAQMTWAVEERVRLLSPGGAMAALVAIK